MPKYTRIGPLDSAARMALVERYETAPDPETRTRYQMVLLANDYGLGPPQIAPLVQRSHDVVLRVLQRYQAGGLEAVPRRVAPGKQPTVTPAWEAELLRVIDADPHAAGVESANWTTGLLADYLARATGVAVDLETVRRHLHRLGYVCKRPVWTVQYKAAERPEWVGNASGRRSS